MQRWQGFVGLGMAGLLVSAAWALDPAAWAAEMGMGRAASHSAKREAGAVVSGRSRQSTAPAIFVPGPVWFGVQDQLVSPYPLLIPQSPGTVMTGTRLVVVEGGRVRLFDLNGNALSRAIRTHGSASVAILATRILVTDDGRVRVYDWNGNQQGTEILTTGLTAVSFAPARFAVADASRLRLFDYNANSLGTEIATDP